MITTTPVFYYGYKITSENYYINLNEGNGEITAQLTQGNYSAESLAIEVARALSEHADQDYNCLFDRETRQFIISAPSNFSLLAFTGSNIGLGAFQTLGFTATDKIGRSAYRSENPSGMEFIPQFPLQDYVGFDDLKEYAEANINESSSGLIEVYSIGLRSFMEFNITLATNIPQGRNGIITTNPNGVANLRNFMQYCISKGEVEFMPDETDRNNYYTITLERTPTSSTGTGYLLKELYGQGLPGYFETGNLRWRLRE